MSKIPLSAPVIMGNEWDYIKDCLDTSWVSSAGNYVDKFEESISSYTGSKYAIACVNGTSALQLSLRLLGVKSGDEVMVPTLTFIAPINAVRYLDANPIFFDCDQYFNIDVEKTIDFIKNETFFKNGITKNKLTKKKISAIIPVHVWGNASNIKELIKICNDRNIAIVEDASESLGTFYKDSYLKHSHTGTIGKIGCISFNGNKIITTGGGGMILTDDFKIAEKARYLSTQAKDDPIKYIHNEIGYNFRLTNLQAAMGLAQTEKLNIFLENKRKIHNYYQSLLKNVDGLKISDVPSYASNNFWLNILKIDEKIITYSKNQLIKKMNENNIECRPVWRLNHLQIPYKNFQTYFIEKSTKLVETSICLPSSVNLAEKDIDKIVETICG